MPVEVATGTPLRMILYPATPILSVEPVHDRSISLEDVAVAERLVGVEGGELPTRIVIVDVA